MSCCSIATDYEAALADAEVVRDNRTSWFSSWLRSFSVGVFFPFAASCEAPSRPGSTVRFRIRRLFVFVNGQGMPRISAILAVSKVPCRVLALDPALKRRNEPIKTALATQPSVRSTPAPRTARPGAPERSAARRPPISEGHSCPHELRRGDP